MKAQTKALVASLIIVALGLSAVSGVTYSWFSDSEQAEISVTTATFNVKQQFGEATIDGDTLGVVGVASSSDGNITIRNLVAGVGIGIPVDVCYKSTIKVISRTVVEISSSGLSAGDKNGIEINDQSLSSIGSTLVLKDWESYDATNSDSYEVIDTPDLIISTVGWSSDSESEKYLSIKVRTEMYQGNYVYEGFDGQTIISTGVVSGTTTGVSQLPITVDFTGVSGVSGKNFKAESKNSSTGFVIQEGGSVKAIIGLTLDDGDCSFGTNQVRITIKVNGNITASPISVIYDGTEYSDQPTLISATFDGQDTVVVFTTTHFSDFVIGSQITESADGKTHYIWNADQLFSFSDKVKLNSRYYEGMTVNLMADIDLAGRPWDPLGNSSNPFLGTFDGNNNTIYNLNVIGPSDNTGNGPSGFVAWLGQNESPAHVKNLTIDGAKVIGTHYVGAVAGYLGGGSIENCVVKNSTLINNYGGGNAEGDKTGAIVGQTNTETGWCTINQCTVENVIITGFRDIGCIVGASYELEKITNCLVKGNNKIIIDQTGNHETKDPNAGPILGRNLGSVTVNSTNNVEDNSISISAKVCTSGQFNKVLTAGISDISVQGNDVFVFNTTGSAPSGMAKDIKITLLTDVVFKADSATQSTNAFGWSNTGSIIIDGKGLYKLTFDHPDSDANHVTTNGAKLILKNLYLSNSGYNNGPWNRHDIVFDCTVSLENVNSDKAIALGSDAIFNHVTIKDSDVYGLWIKADGQTVTLENVTIEMGSTDGRAIAVKDQYVNDPQKVTLTITDSVIKSQTKAAVLVTSTAGAMISAQNVDISGVSADNTNLVWIDDGEGYANITDTTVSGGTAIIEP